MLTIAHRGASAYAPENTRAAFDRAIEMGAPMIETDVQQTRDNELVLIHDDVVDRTTDGMGPVADHELEDLLRLDAGSWFDAAFAGERIVTLRAFCSEYLPRIPACLEIKEPFAADPLIDFLAAHPEALARIHLTSFSWQAVVRATAALDVPTGFLSRSFNRDLVDRCARRGLAQICPPASALDADLIGYAHERGLAVRAWGVASREDVDRLFATGADGATCNWPDWMLEHPEHDAHLDRFAGPAFPGGPGAPA
jgi:glycerophosphoryl diester phosphodiesterase